MAQRITHCSPTLLVATTLLGPAAPLLGQAGAQISPPGLVNTFAGLTNSIPWGPFVPLGNTQGEIFYQQIDAALIGTPRLLRGFAFRHQWNAAHAAKSYTLTIDLGDAASLPAGIQQTFASNWKSGGARTTVFQGTLNFPAVPAYVAAPGPADAPVAFMVLHAYTGVDPLLWQVNIAASNPVQPTLYFEHGPATRQAAGRIGDGCIATGGTLPLSSFGDIGATLLDNLVRGPFSRPATLLLGDTANAIGTQTLPWNLAFVGSPSCFLHVNPLVSLGGVSTNAAGSAAISIPYVPTQSTPGVRLRTQWVMLDSAAKIVTSNGLDHCTPYSAGLGVPWPQSRVYQNGFGSTLPATGLTHPSGIVTEWRY